MKPLKAEARQRKYEADCLRLRAVLALRSPQTIIPAARRMDLPWLTRACVVQDRIDAYNAAIDQAVNNSYFTMLSSTTYNEVNRLIIELEDMPVTTGPGPNNKPWYGQRPGKKVWA